MTLIQSVLATLPNYIMTVIHLPNEILTRLQKEFRAFLWGHPIDRKGMHLVAWHNICNPKDKRGLGFVSLFQKCKALFAKLAAQLILNSSSLWANLVRAKYSFNASWHNYKKLPNCSHTWAWIMDNGHNIAFNFKSIIGSGEQISLLQDPWLSKISIYAWPTYINMNMDVQNQKIKQLIKPDRSWNID